MLNLLIYPTAQLLGCSLTVIVLLEYQWPDLKFELRIHAMCFLLTFQSKLTWLSPDLELCSGFTLHDQQPHKYEVGWMLLSFMPYGHTIINSSKSEHSFTAKHVLRSGNKNHSLKTSSMLQKWKIQSTPRKSIALKNWTKLDKA